MCEQYEGRWKRKQEENFKRVVGWNICQFLILRLLSMCGSHKDDVPRSRLAFAGCLWCLTNLASRSAVLNAAPCRVWNLCMHETYCTADGKAAAREGERERLKTSCSPISPRTLELNFIGASNSHSPPLFIIFTSRMRLGCECFPISWLLFFLLFYTFTHFATHRFGLFTFACGFTIFLLLPFLTWMLFLLLLSSSSRNGFRFALGRALFVLRPSIFFFSVASWKRYREDVLKTNASGKKNFFCVGLSIGKKKFFAPV